MSPEPPDRPDQRLQERLSRLRPAPLPDGLRARVAARLSAEPAQRLRPTWAWAVLIAGAAAAAVAAAVWFDRTGPDRPKPEPPVAAPTPTPTPPKPGRPDPEPPHPGPLAAAPAPPPTLWAYQQAAAAGSGELDRLLDRHAADLLPPGPITASARGGAGRLEDLR